ncbi:hypothetical protein [Paenibacillus sp. HB172176]|uniref:hypothetical protein n=1 Tax=Paenibacillus sp. HB172176 TaxID=2493690 RepID=UPI00143A3420|nr:hypothetical protein [Paenibacillus sp. HB172176]
MSNKVMDIQSSVQARKQAYLSYSSELKAWPKQRHYITNCLARLAVGQSFNEDQFTRALNYFVFQRDCWDFNAQILLRMLYLYGDSPLWSQDLKDQVHEQLLVRDYWFTDHSSRLLGVAIIWTENHVMLHHSAEYLAAQLYPDDHFTTRNLKGSEVLPIVKAQIEHWIHVKKSVGFSEWDSNCYMVENIMSLLNLYDFAKDEELRAKAKELLDLICFSMAVNSYKGVYGCTHGRTYTGHILNPEQEGTSAAQYILWGLGNLKSSANNLGATTLALSTYEPEPFTVAIARDTESVYASKEQMSFDVEDGPLLGKGYHEFDDLTLYWHNMGYTHRLIIDRVKDMSDKYGNFVNDIAYSEWKYYQDCRARGESGEAIRMPNYMGRINKLTYKTPDYMLSCAQDFRRGEKGFQQHIWQACMDDGIAVFVTHPGKEGVGTGRPDLWSGNDIMPRAVQYKDTLIGLYHVPEDSECLYTHAYMPREKFDECCEIPASDEAGRWVFAKKNEGYVALYSQHGFTWQSSGPYADQELICTARSNVWICQMGRAAEHGSFAAFIASVLASDIACSELAATCHRPDGTRLELGWSGEFLVNGKAEKIREYKRFDNPYCQSEWLSGEHDFTNKYE